MLLTAAIVLAAATALPGRAGDGVPDIGVPGGDNPASAAHATEQESARLYRTREEQREAGRKTELTPWLTVAGLAELEMTRDYYHVEAGGRQRRERDEAVTVQLVFTADLFGLAAAEAIFEYDSEADGIDTDEFFVAVEEGPWELAAGRMYTPFGVYYSNFVTGPMLEFGETRATRAVTLAYGPSDDLDLSLTVYRGDAREMDSDPGGWDMVVALEVVYDDHWSFGWSVQSDLADADDRLLEDSGDRWARRVPGLSGYLLWSGERHEATVEVLAAASSFAELGDHHDQPWAWNAELVRFFPRQDFQLAFRVEGSSELEDEPGLRYGVAASWRVAENAGLTLEYLHGRFNDGLTANDDDLSYDRVDRLGALVTIQF